VKPFEKGRVDNIKIKMDKAEIQSLINNEE
jgi:hypothetical protein